MLFQLVSRKERFAFFDSRVVHELAPFHPLTKFASTAIRECFYLMTAAVRIKPISEQPR